MDWSRVLFVGWGDAEGVSHYRTVLPAKELGAEYVVFGMDGTGKARSGTRKTHDLIVFQHGWEPWQARILRRMRNSGAKVVINVDDWILGLANMGENHGYSKQFSQKRVQQANLSMLREADGVFASTPWLMERVRSINPTVFEAPNGLDLRRYRRYWKNKPYNPEKIVLGWAGGTGHRGAFASIAGAVNNILHIYPQTELHFVGDSYIEFIDKKYAGRVKHYAWSDLHFYPRNLAGFDINLAPAQDNDFYRAKSQLRVYEAAAMGTPTVGHPMYSDIEAHGIGFVYEDPTDLAYKVGKLVTDHELRAEMSSRSVGYSQLISIENRVEPWKTAIQMMLKP